MEHKKRIFWFIIIIFIIAFFWELFFTYGLGLFWEDFNLYRLDKEKYPVVKSNAERITAIGKTLQGFVKEFFSVKKLFFIGFGSNWTDRPYQFLTDQLLGLIFVDKALGYRIFKAFIFSLNVCLLFLFLNRSFRLLALGGVLLYITSAEVWESVAYSSDVAVYACCGELLAVFLFLRLIDKKILLKKKLWLYYFLILLCSNYAVLAKGNGRYLAVIFFLTLLFFQRGKILFHLPMLAILLLMELPVLGYIKMLFVKVDFFPIYVGSHNKRPVSEMVGVIMENFKYPRTALGEFLLIILLITALTHLYLLFRKNNKFFKVNEPFDSILKERTFFFILWFACSFTMIACSRCFSYAGPVDWTLMELAFVILPFIVFLCCYVNLVFSRIRKPYHIVFKRICILLVALQLLVNFIRIGRFRTGWGNYFCAWHNSEKYIEKIADNALALTISGAIYKPFLFYNSNNKNIHNRPFTIKHPFDNLNFIENKFKEGYKNIFVAKKGKVKFLGESDKVILKQVKIIGGDSGDLYDYLARGLYVFSKRFVKLPSFPEMYVYHFQYADEG